MIQMKRKVIILLVLLLSCFSACEKPQKSTTPPDAPSSQDHVICSFSDWEMTIQPTCTTKGVKERKCSICQKIDTQEIEASGHTIKSYSAQAPTCTASGWKEYEKCTECDYTTYEEVVKFEAEEIYEIAKDCTVEIKTYDKNGEALALGSGFVFTADGQIVTNYHVIEEACSADIYVGDKKYSVDSVLAYDIDKDIAIVKINANNLQILKVCTKPITTGTTVYALGSSGGLTSTFSQGIITAANREIEDVVYIQHDAAISNGNSGGPLINEYCEIIGINTLTMKDSQNLNFAIFVSEIDGLVNNTPMTLEEVYEKECNVFMKVKNFVIQNGSYDSSDNDYTLTLGYTYSSDYSYKYTRMISYDIADDELRLMLFIDADNLVSIHIDEIDGVYDWGYIDTYDYYMFGTLYATTFTSNHLLGYSYSNISSSSLKTSIRELASSMASLLIIYTNTDLAEIGVTAADLGFVNF